MSKGSILKMALDEIVGGVKKVDLEDLPSTSSVSAGIQAVKRMAGGAGKKVANTVDDWGWKGAPKGRLSADDYDKIKDNAQQDAWHSMQNRLGRDFDESNAGDLLELSDETDELTAERLLPIAQQWEKGGILPGYLIERNGTGIEEFANEGITDNVANSFRNLQKADIPWDYTGKVFKALAAREKQTMPEIPRSVASAVSKAMEPMTPDQRSEFLSLLPEWDGGIDELVEMLRTV